MTKPKAQYSATSNIFSNDLLEIDAQALRWEENKYHLWSLLNQQNRVIDLAPHIANRASFFFRTAFSVYWCHYHDFSTAKGWSPAIPPASECTTRSIRMSALQMFKAGTWINFWHCGKGLLIWQTSTYINMMAKTKDFQFHKNIITCLLFAPAKTVVPICIPSLFLIPCDSEFSFWKFEEKSFLDEYFLPLLV